MGTLIYDFKLLLIVIFLCIPLRLFYVTLYSIIFINNNNNRYVNIKESILQMFRDRII